MTDRLVTGKLIVDDTSDSKQKLTVRSDSFFTGFLRVGALAAVGYNVLAIADVQGNLGVGGDTVLAGQLTVNGANGIFVQGPFIVSNNLQTNTPHGIVCGGSLAVAGTTTLQQDLAVSGSLTVSGPLTSVSSITATSLTVAGDTTLGNTTLLGTLSLPGAGEITLGNITVGGVLRINKNPSAQVSGGLTVNGLVSSSGATGMTVQGPFVIDNTLQTNGIVCGGVLGAADNATFQQDLVVSRHVVAAVVSPSIGGASLSGGGFLVATIAPGSFDWAGQINIINGQFTGGSKSLQAGDYVRVKFANPYPAGIVVLACLGASSGEWGLASVQVTQQSSETFTVTLLGPSGSIANRKSVSINYIVLGKTY